MTPTCAKGHVRTEENTSWVKRGDRPGVRIRCKDCHSQREKARRGHTSPSVIEMSRQATDYLHEDIEDMLNFGATYSEILERGGYSSWNTLQKSLKRRGRTDLLDALLEKKAKV